MFFVSTAPYRKNLHLSINAQVKEILKKHASIRAICHLDLMQTSIEAKEKRVHRNNQVMKVCFALEMGNN